MTYSNEASLQSWGEVSIIDAAENIIDYRGRTPKKLGMDWGGGEIVALSAGNVKNGYIDFDAECYLGSEELYRRWMTSGHPQKNDIVFTMEAPLGNAALIPDDEKYILSQRTILIQLKRELFDPQFVFQLLLSDQFQSYLIDNATGSTAQGIKRKTFEKLKLNVPHTLCEQRAIARALSDTDALIEGLEKLIAKKHAIKTATMQQLLTGKTRLPQFAKYPDGTLKGTKPSELGEIPEDWSVVRLGKISSFLKGNGLPKSELTEDGKYKCVHYGQLFTTYGEEINSVLSTTDIRNNPILSQCNDVLMPTSDVTPNGLATASCIQEDDVILGGDIMIIRSEKDLLNGVFLAYAVRSSRDKVMQLVTGSTVYHLYGRDMANFTFALPSLEEQRQVIDILANMNAEILALRQRLAKTRQIKQGMMQQLLTGKIRLVQPELAPA